MKEKRSFTMTKFVWTLTWLGSLACIAATGYGTYVIIDKYNNDDNLMVVSITITCFVLGIPFFLWTALVIGVIKLVTHSQGQIVANRKLKTAESYLVTKCPCQKVSSLMMNDE